MIHIPAEHIRNEMLSLQQFTRATLSESEGEDKEPTLIVKAKSIHIKYLFKSSKIRVLIGKTDNQCLMYGLLIEDDPKSPFCSWSLVELPEELEALQRIISGERFMLALFNEVAVNVCGALVSMNAASSETRSIAEAITLADSKEWQTAQDEAQMKLNVWHSSRTELQEIQSTEITTWKSTECVYFTNQLEPSSINFLDTDEGGQQEQLGAWITDSLHPNGVYQNPDAIEKRRRELCDLLLTYDSGTFLFESKALAVLSREELPYREKLQDDIDKHIEKAVRQLAGACKNLRSGIKVLARNGEEIVVQREIPQHCVILIPDLSLLSGIEGQVFGRIEEFHSKSKAILNIVDPSHLFNLMMDSNNLVYSGHAADPMIAFDALLLRRFEAVMENRNPQLIFLCRF